MELPFFPWVYVFCEYLLYILVYGIYILFDVLKSSQNKMDKDEYFSSYEDLEIHRIMLEDHPRNDAYYKAITNSKSIFKDKVVMDVGCGTGILSIMCAQAGAKKVYAVEASKLIHIAKEIVKQNKCENIVEVIQSKVEDVLLPDNVKVDIIVSEWMGFYLLHEGMLDSVLVARDEFLKEDGLMFPGNAAIYVAPCSVPSLYHKWNNIHGVSMNEFAKHLRASKCCKPEIDVVKPEDLLAPEEVCCWIDLKEVQSSDLESINYQYVGATNRPGAYQGLCIWFDCYFPNSANHENIILSTGPASPQTHWKQTLIVLPDEQIVEEGEPIAFALDITRDKINSRRYNLQMTVLDPEAVEHPVPCPCHMTKCILIKTFMAQHAEADKSGIVEEKIDDDMDENND